MTFATTEITLTGPWRSPAQMLEEQEVDGHSSIHDGDTAASLGLTGAPIEAPTHFSQFDPLAFRLWGRRWFEHGCISCHFRTMVVEGEQVQASLTTTGVDSATVEAHKTDGTPVLTGTASVGPDHPPSALTERLAAFGDPGDLHIVDRLHVGMRSDTEIVSVDRSTPNGSGYPFSLDDKLARITEASPWYSDGAADNPWGRAILPFEMISVLASKSGFGWPVRGPVLGLFLDLEVRLLGTPLFVGEPYALSREVVGLGQSRRTESYWTRTSIARATGGDPVAEVLLHSGVFKDSFAGYPKAQ
ncbi:hypothetical protein [Desertimonas flava]|uniref:hypothetical protein n=1 Tax=Desertimonas flava TaxID=2064846 RepID=UPI000E350B4A|nr:hypothetical protein [Desertimonas flava]